MLAARIDQENYVHDQQTAAAAKPLNQGLRGLPTRTPGNKAPKTPFKVPLNDENVQLRGGKSVLKTNIKILDKTGKAGPVFDKTAFITPAGPTNRPALGAKTTNAKANVFKTPANKNGDSSPAKTQKTGSPRLRRPKLKVLKPEVVEQESDGELDIEYMPPRELPLPDYDSDDEFGPNKTFPHLASENLTRGWARAYMNPLDGDGLTRMERQMLEAQNKFENESEIELQRATEDCLAEIERDVRLDLGLPLLPTKEASSSAKKAPPTLMAKTAASALSRASKPTSGVAKPIPKARAPLALNIRKTSQPPLTSINPSSQRYATASAASRSTLGYSQGRAISQRVRKPVTSVFCDQSRSTSAMTKRSASDEEALAKAADVVSQLRMQELTIRDDGLDDILFPEEDMGMDDFQLPLPGVGG